MLHHPPLCGAWRLRDAMLVEMPAGSVTRRSLTYARVFISHYLIALSHQTH